MTILLSLILLGVLFIMIYNIITVVVVLPDIKLGNSYKRQIKKSKKEHILTRLIAKKIRLNLKKRRKIEIELQKAGLSVSPEIYFASIYAIIFSGLSVSIIAALFISKFIAVGILLITAGNYQKKYDSLVKKRNQRIEEIEIELPFFVRYFMSQLKYTKDVAKIFKRYIDQQGKSPLTEEIQITLSEMLSSSTKEDMMQRAIENTINRSDVEKLRELFRGILGILKGEDQYTFFLMLDRDMKELAMRNVIREGEKLPKKAKASTWLVVGMFCICLFGGFVQMIIAAFNNL